MIHASNLGAVRGFTFICHTRDPGGDEETLHKYLGRETEETTSFRTSER